MIPLRVYAQRDGESEVQWWISNDGGQTFYKAKQKSEVTLKHLYMENHGYNDCCFNGMFPATNKLRYRGTHGSH